VFSLKEFSASKHQGLVLCPSCVPEKVGINQKGINKKHLHKKKKKKTQINGNKTRQRMLNRK